MFYSHEILTSRKYGVATVWLVATLGAKSNTKKVTRKAILDVDVAKACETIIQPEAPMALRLQSNLLYGVSRVYNQQCGYVLHDAQIAQNSMRALLRVTKNNDLDAAATKPRPEQLMLMDDPAFNLDMALPALDFEFTHTDLAAGDSQRSSQSMMSISGGRSVSITSHDGSALGINLPSSSLVGGYQLPSNDHFGPTSAHKGLGGTGRDIFDNETELLEDDLAFEFDEDGNIVDIDADEQAQPVSSAHPHGRPVSDSAAGSRVRKDHEDGLAGRKLPIIDGEDDYIMNFEDDDMHLPDVEPFPTMSGGLGGKDKLRLLLNDDRVYSEEASSESAEAPQKRRKPKVRKRLAPDQATEFRNSDLLLWQREYLAKQEAEQLLKQDKKSKTCAKKNAFSFVWGAGLNDVGNGVGLSKLASPLDMFSGEALLAKITGRSSLFAEEKKKKTKHALDLDDEQEESPKRARHTAEVEDEVGRGTFDEDEEMNIMEDSSIGEIGRDAVSALQDHPSSAIMPWNVSQSLHSHRGASGSIPGLNSQARRLTSASPLVGRGSNLPGDMLDLMNDDDQAMYGRDNSPSLSNNDDDAFLRRRASRAPSSSQAEADFELFGPAAQVDTQTAGNSQWVREALDRESGNFFDYVTNSIAEKFDDNFDAEMERFVTFEELFAPQSNSAMVAAQAFYHVLTLATKGKVWVEQEGEEEGEPFGAIRVCVFDIV